MYFWFSYWNQFDTNFYFWGFMKKWFPSTGGKVLAFLQIWARWSQIGSTTRLYNALCPFHEFSKRWAFHQEKFWGSIFPVFLFLPTKKKSRKSQNPSSCLTKNGFDLAALMIVTPAKNTSTPTPAQTFRKPDHSFYRFLHVYLRF